MALRWYECDLRSMSRQEHDRLKELIGQISEMGDVSETGVPGLYRCILDEKINPDEIPDHNENE